MLRGTRRFDPIRASARCSAGGRARGPMSAHAHPRERRRAFQPAGSLMPSTTSDRSQTSPRWSARRWRMRHRMRVEPAASGPIKHTCLTRVCFCANFSSKQIGMGWNSAETAERFKTACCSGDLSRTALGHEPCVQENRFGRVLLPRVFDGGPLGWPRVAYGDTRPRDFGRALQPLPVEAVTLGPPAQRPHPQAFQPAGKGAQEPAPSRVSSCLSLNLSLIVARFRKPGISQTRPPGDPETGPETTAHARRLSPPGRSASHGSGAVRACRPHARKAHLCSAFACASTAGRGRAR